MTDADLSQRLAAWQDRFRALVGDDSPDGAGNRVITLQAELARREQETCENCKHQMRDNWIDVEPLCGRFKNYRCTFFGNRCGVWTPRTEAT